MRSWFARVSSGAGLELASCCQQRNTGRRTKTRIRSAGSIRRLAVIGVLSAVLGAGVGVTTATVASAYATTGCKYAKSAISPITYRFYSVSDTNEYAVKSAVSAWNATSAPGSFGERSTLADPELSVTDDT